MGGGLSGPFWFHFGSVCLSLGFRVLAVSSRGPLTQGTLRSRPGDAAADLTDREEVPTSASEGDGGAVRRLCVVGLGPQ